MFEKLFNKPKENTRVEQQKNTALGVSAMKIIAKNTLNISTLAKELKTINRSFIQLVRLEGGEPVKSDSLKDYNKKNSSMKELHIADRKVKRMKEEQRPADFLVVLFDKFITILKIVFLGTLLSGIILSEKLIEWMDLKGLYKKITSFFNGISDGFVNFFGSIDWTSLFQSHIGDLVNFISFGMFTKKDAMLIVQGAGNFTSEIMHRFGEILVSAAKILKGHLEKLGRFLAIDVLGVDYEEMDRQKKERNEAVEMSESLKKDNDALDAEMKSLQDKRNILNEKKDKRQKEEAQQRIKQAEEEAKKKETVGDKLKKMFTPKEEVVEEKAIKISTGAAGFGLTAPTPVAPKPPATPPPVKDTPPSFSVTPKTDVTPIPEPAPPQKELPKGNLSTLMDKQTGVDISQFKPEFEKRITAMAAAFKQQTGKLLIATSGYRSNEKQKQLYDEDLANNNGKPTGLVARPIPPLGTGTGSVHLFGLGIDIKPTSGRKGTGSPKGFLNELAGTRTKSTGWLEKFGLIRNVKGEDWHITIAGAPPTADDSVVTTDSGATIDPSSGESKGRNLDIGKSSAEIAAEQRKQEKRKKAVVINADTTNNTLIKNQNHVVATA